jgi:transcription elongation factor Elf1
MESLDLRPAYTVRLNGKGKGSIEYVPAGKVSTCDDCDAVTSVTIEPYGTGHMATIKCPNCGVSYDTNLDPVEGAGK